nr:zf-CCHC domain-containing protein/UBN2 domain-containing protein [Tanacetum cinerariifolium]
PNYSSKNHVRKFLHALPLKYRAKVTAIKEAKDLDTLPLDEVIGNLKVYEMVLDNDGMDFKTTKEKFKTLDLKAKVTRKQTSDDSDSQEVKDEETKLMKETPYELLSDTEKKQLGKNEEAKMTIYNALPRKEYERVFMCKTTKEFKTLDLKAKVTRKQTSDDSDSQGESDEEVDKEEAEAFNLFARNF